jgi:hypothetical protein
MVEEIINTSQSAPNRNLSYPDQIRDQALQVASTVKMLMEITKSLSTLRRVFRGEALYQSDDGTTTWLQVVKPMFIKINPYTREPYKEKLTLPNGEEREIFLPNDEAIEELLSQLFFMGMNNITPLTNLDENTVLDDLKEFECKLAGLLALKQVQWGLDKSTMPMIMTKIKTVVQDARYMCVQGGTMKALTQQVSRIENVLEGDKNMSRVASKLYG